MNPVLMSKTSADLVPNPAVVSQIKSWFEKAVPDPTAANVHAQIAVHIEEFIEMLEVLRSASRSFRLQEQFGLAIDVLSFLERHIKAMPENDDIVIEDISRSDMLDALCDQIVTAIGVSHMLHMDPSGGLQEVARSNDSKFDETGNPIFNQTRKIMKGPNYTPPDLLPYV